jgi:GrpB-like predicted nucleotidyltransferase (UPF0157 family)
LFSVPAVKLFEYIPRWPSDFADIAARLRESLGPLAVRIDHIGSTSVPRLAAKNIIDVQVTVESLDIEVLRPRMLEAGFQHLSDVRISDHHPAGSIRNNEDWRKLLFVELEGQREANVHVRAAGRANQRYALLFRDYLRAEPAAAAAYGQVKSRLARLDIDRAAYTDTKDPVCDLIIVAAEAWARQTGWQPGPSDA